MPAIPGGGEQGGRAAGLAVAGAAVAATAMLLLAPLPRAWEGGWRGQLLDLGHVPLFATLTLTLGREGGGRWHWPTLLALTLAALAEVAQPFLGRSGSVADFLRGAAGVLAAATLLRAARGPRTWPRLVGHGLAALALVALPVGLEAPKLLDAAEGLRDFPTLADFRADRRLLRWECQQAMLTRVEAPGNPGERAGRLEFRPGPAPYPGATLEHVVRDLRDYRCLCWSFVVEGGPLTLTFSVRGGPDSGGVTSHYQFGREYGPGEHTAVMDLSRAARLGEEGPLDLADLSWSQVFAVRPREATSVYLLRVWVE